MLSFSTYAFNFFYLFPAGFEHALLRPFSFIMSSILNIHLDFYGPWIGTISTLVFCKDSMKVNHRDHIWALNAEFFYYTFLLCQPVIYVDPLSGGFQVIGFHCLFDQHLLNETIWHKNDILNWSVSLLCCFTAVLWALAAFLKPNSVLGFK